MDFKEVKPLIAIAEMLKVKTGTLLIPGFVVVMTLVFTGIASNFLVTLLGFMYPAYMSMKALDNNKKHAKVAD